MEAVKSYLLSVSGAAMISGIVIRLAGSSGSHSAVVKMIAGIFLVFTVISPLAKLQLTDFSLYLDGLSASGDSAVEMGSQQARDAAAEIIKAETESYILDKAASLSLNIQADVTLSDDDLLQPSSVTLNGEASPFARQQLQRQIAQELGIPEEKQTWK